MKHILGEIDLSSTQLRSIEILLKKALPDLQAITMSGELKHNHETVDLAALDTTELENLERTLAKATVINGSESGDSTQEVDKLH